MVEFELKTVTITEQLDAIVSEVCDNLCKYPEQCKDESELEEHCRSCPLRRI